mmetsp:Transcript_20354/g.30604  ORF Transcript_20354/g.30604 Transcript_20354/m.30604 type:complete len:517 (-) Transcript_20354:1315-2865(-)|eukprot:CAMPEP_0178897724 /NCGR_PEP_ID=MMETSP0786-20121207/1914_1 /TAXON_ID=186022 /ORGANISM="Thalassionema frauenfeldii, Strain CCMP 1798" /LENGTH=516 /DNA_ID=CAMNT_0020568323 /DNA_START=126 /DNA_END=1676 /DNA_ORIENTATION=+
MAENADNSETSNENTLKEKDLRIASLERTKLRQEKEILDLRRELGTVEIEHKEQIYWLRMELDKFRQEKEDIEDRMDTLYRNMKEMESEINTTETEGSTDPEYVGGLQAQVKKYTRTLGILEEQNLMVRQSCDETVKNLKEEIADIMDDKVRMEMDLLNQFASLDSEKRELEIEFEEQMKYKDSMIDDLRQGVALSVSSKDKEKEESMMKEIDDLKVEREKLEQEILAERAESNEATARLEETNAILQKKIDSMASDLDIMRAGAASETVQILDALNRDREETISSLERVAIIWDKADESMRGLEEVMDKLRPYDDRDLKGDAERSLSTLETASLVHGQIKVALLLVEMKLRNQLNTLKNDKLGTGAGASVAANRSVAERMAEIQEETLAALSHVEDSLSSQMRQLEIKTREETENLKQNLLENTEDRKSMQMSQLKTDEDIKTGGDFGITSNGISSISRKTIERLQNEILKVVERVKEKNETILRLKTSIDEYKVRESALKKELKRMMKRARGMN